MSFRKIVLVIVEGPSEDEALSVILEKIYSNNTVRILIMHRDITSEKGVSSDNIISKISKTVSTYAISTHFKKSDFQEIIHIVDTDGAYIPNSHIIEDKNLKKTIYSPTYIKTNNKIGIEARNKQKSSNINKIWNCKKVWGINYHLFYMSCNLDHVLYNKLNSTNKEKWEDSFDFAKKYKENIPRFISFISGSDFSVTSSYEESWDFIKKDLHSLERHTNLGVCFSEDSSLLKTTE
ncbi:hypothetical protein IKS86_03490 [bacterium]|nr:hypothetical protein [bacterium]